MHKLVQILRVLSQICGAALFWLIVAPELLGLADRVLPPRMAFEFRHWADYVLFGASNHYGRDNWDWTWPQIPHSLAFFATILLLAGAGWTAIRSWQGLAPRFLGWQPQMKAKRLVPTLVVIGSVYPAVIVGFYYKSPYPVPIERIADTIGGILLLTVPPFLNGGILAWLVGAPRTVWLAGVMGPATLRSTLQTLYLWRYDDS